MDQVGDINPFPSEQEYRDDVEKGRRARVSVSFFNILDELPLLTNFTLNGNTLCTNHKYARPSTTTRVARRISVL
ncbi:uncharacterized protein LOC108092134 isoform X2 [Drosophila ficusphila]|uniref:uncharacterized protein LOC108092134 isoform X2 n=1 Tax=Drosophila ficusphila TaxID=30025 RepID=UPI0007E86992|nr:uncharacterized protein LOC108092134 isoform X2 [Drosophila ficusphila]